MRIAGGDKKGQKLLWDAAGTRPMREFVRAALFNILQEVIVDARFLDLFAGTGSVGIEALSRRAAEVIFVDHSATACAIIRKNLAALQLTPYGHVYQEDFLSALDRFYRRGRVFEIIFAGPPYNTGLADQTLQRLGELPLVAADGIVVTEVYKREVMKDSYNDLILFDKREYNDNLLLFYRLTN
ncbi:16S rRNA (guanine(966)-N(2))-methyltransferase RsmD [Candidatus Acetothermia bacterium]|nr:16S rRNA (guanine(966)-N(2))-methyltransferase RsmD [Candidatus Acetothermia bacterium]